jgi:hypothetical protein
MRIKFEALGCVSLETHFSNIEHAWSLKPKRVEKWGSGPLAICGGGPSLKRNLDKLRDYSEVWAVNGTAKWLCDQGINAVMFSVDPNYQPTKGIKRAVLASCTHPNVLKSLKRRGADFRVYALTPDEGEPWCAMVGPTSACRAPWVALRAGYTRFDFYGCEGSYEETASYADGRDYETEAKLVIKAGGRFYVTEPEFVMQCEFLAEFIREFPDHTQNHSMGLLQAMTDHPDDWEVVAFSKAVADAVGIDAGDLIKFEIKEAV